MRINAVYNTAAVRYLLIRPRDGTALAKNRFNAQLTRSFRERHTTKYYYYGRFAHVNTVYVTGLFLFLFIIFAASHLRF